MPIDEPCGSFRMRKLFEEIDKRTPEERTEQEAALQWADDDASDVEPDSELDLVRIYAKSLNNLSFEILEPYLADDVQYTSQVVWETLVGKTAVSAHLVAKMEAIRNDLPNSDVYAEIGYCGDESGRSVQLWGSAGRPCVLIAQGDIRVPSGLILLETESKMIKSICICTVVPDPTKATRTGEYAE